ncbi:NAD(P)/FAD-dependent oxidoreductase [Paremcibacter congregatus]|uniref:FAD-dependent oxidoreductase n=1 Tax=Paremcibacter congregatus TaxID=2043170 RepID=A0A2G4YQQ2_9PROT|nr:FAD-binding oxidoreductase [Paremcibacter congregatus]PHZ84617.1 FAD-dependent oxidoreductase [Paremcibacter congregatus]QDE28838.1 FAD-binding oxidoreductase [Paremcibacter congregatus]
MEQYDVLIIGGGLVGCASAYHLAQRGASVLLAEKGDINRQASGQNAGSLHFQLEHRLIEHGDALAEQFSRIIPLNRLAAELWADLETELEAPLEVVMKGGLMAALTDTEVTLLKKKHALEQKNGMDTQLLTGEDARRKAPYLCNKVLAAAYFPGEGHANPRLVTPAYARAARKKGASIRKSCEVISLYHHKDRWIATLQTEEGRTQVSAGKILNAAGAWAASSALLAHIHLPVFPVPLMMNVTEAAPAFLPHLVQRASAKLSMKQVADGNILIGGGWSSRFQMTNGRPDFDKRPALIEQNVIRNLALAAELVPDMTRHHLLRCWTGVVGVTADQLPLLGEVPGFPGYYIAAGGSGFTLGPVYARLMGELMTTGATAYDISLFSPARFDHINGFMKGG